MSLTKEEKENIHKRVEHMTSQERGAMLRGFVMGF